MRECWQSESVTLCYSHWRPLLLPSSSSQAQLFWWDLWAQRVDCCTVFALVWRRHQLSYDLKMWQGASGGNTWELDTCCMFPCACFAGGACTTFWGLHCAVSASRGCWKPCEKNLWRCRGRSRHLGWEQRETAAWAPPTGTPDTGTIDRHNSLTRPQVQKACKHIAKWGACTCRFTSFAACGARCTSSQDQPDISAGRRQRGKEVHETEDTQTLKKQQSTHIMYWPAVVYQADK